MIRALLPVTAALGLAVLAGILLAQNGVLHGISPAMFHLSSASSGGGCCPNSEANGGQARLADGESACCSSAAGSCCGDKSFSEETLTSLNVGGEDEAFGSGCPFAGTSGMGSSCSADGEACCSSSSSSCPEGRDCAAEAECDADGAGCCKQDKACSSSDGGECCREEKSAADSAVDESVAAVTK